MKKLNRTVIPIVLCSTALLLWAWQDSPTPCALPTYVQARSYIPIGGQWKGINYFPRGHQFYNMLNDWYAIDQITGKPVKDLVAEDMAMLNSHGFNFLHLYLWDNTWFGVGFEPVGKNPCSSANRQFEALDEFLFSAEKYGFHVGLHFTAKSPIENLWSDPSLEEAAKEGEALYEWTRTFIINLGPRHQNISFWGLAYALGPVANVEGNKNAWNLLFKSAYQKFYPLVKNSSPTGVQPKVAINLNLIFSASEDSFKYNWNPLNVQQQAMAMREMGLPDPDIYMLQLYNANSLQLARDLITMTGPALAKNALPLDPNKILAVEFGTSSSVVLNPAYGNNTSSSGDAHTPTTTLAGHSQWLNNTLCAFEKTGIKKLAYWTLYDARDFWQMPPFNLTEPEDLAWLGYWGLLSLDPTAEPKPSFKTLSDYYNNNLLVCLNPPRPILSLTTNRESLIQGETATLTWAAADVTRLTIEGSDGSLIQVSKSLGSVKVIPQKLGKVTYVLHGYNINENSISVRAEVSVNILVKLLRI
jgi:hypothetical protein